MTPAAASASIWCSIMGLLPNSTNGFGRVSVYWFISRRRHCRSSRYPRECLGSMVMGGKTYEGSQSGAEATNKNKSYTSCQQMLYDCGKSIRGSPFIFKECRDFSRLNSSIRREWKIRIAGGSECAIRAPRSAKVGMEKGSGRGKFRVLADS